MASQGPNSPGTMADDSVQGEVAWTNPDNAKTSNDVYTTVFLDNTNDDSHYLKATNFGFSIPAGATINGIVVEREVKASYYSGGLSSPRTEFIKIVKANGNLGSENKSFGQNVTDVDAYYSYGGVSDLWSETWTPADINDVDFGIAFADERNGVDGTMSVDHIQITVYYTPTSIKTFNGLVYASTKTVDGLAIASVKTKDGLA